MKKNSRLIQRMVAGILLASGLSMVGAGGNCMVKSVQWDNIQQEVENQRTLLLAQVKISEDFQKQYKEELDLYTNSYLNNAISSDEYEKKIEELNSNNYLETFVKTQADSKLISQLIDFNNQIDTAKNKSAVNTVGGAFLIVGGMIISGFGETSIQYEINRKKEKGIDISGSSASL